MGCWNETCALSGTPIFGGNIVLMVVFKRPEGKEDQLGDVFNWQGPTAIMPHFVGAFRGEYNDYGSIEEDWVPEYISLEDAEEWPKFFVHADLWDAALKYAKEQAALPEKHQGYEYKGILEAHERFAGSLLFTGWMDMLDAMEAKKEPLSTEEVQASLAALKEKQKKKDSLYPLGHEEEFKDLLYIFRFMNCTRKNPWAGSEFSGSQSVSLNEHLLINELSGKILARQKADREEN